MKKIFLTYCLKKIFHYSQKKTEMSIRSSILLWMVTLLQTRWNGISNVQSLNPLIRVFGPVLFGFQILWRDSIWKKYRTGYHVLKGGVIVSARTFFRNDLCSTIIIQHPRRIGSDSKYRWVHDLSLRSRRKKLDVLTKFYLLLFQTFWNLTVFKEKMEICYKRVPPSFSRKIAEGGTLL